MNNQELQVVLNELQKLFNKGMKAGGYELHDANVFIQILTKLQEVVPSGDKNKEDGKSIEKRIPQGPKKAE